MTTDDLSLIGPGACDAHRHVFGPADRFSLFAGTHEAGARGVRFNFVQSLSAYPDPAVFDAVVARIAPDVDQRRRLLVEKPARLYGFA